MFTSRPRTRRGIRRGAATLKRRFPHLVVWDWTNDRKPLVSGPRARGLGVFLVLLWLFVGVRPTCARAWGYLHHRSKPLISPAHVREGLGKSHRTNGVECTSGPRARGLGGELRLHQPGYAVRPTCARAWGLRSSRRSAATRPARRNSNDRSGDRGAVAREGGL